MNPTIQRARELYLAGDLPAPDAVPCVCGAPRAEHSGAAASGGCKATGCGRYRADRIVELAAQAAVGARRTLREDLRAFDAWQRAQQPRKEPGVISVRPSDVGGCDREVWYRELGHEIDGYVPAPTSKGQATAGAIIHDELMRRRSVLYPWRMYGDRRGFELYLPGNPRPSKYDEFDPLTGTLWSLKTAGDWRWEQVQQHGVEDKVIDQDQLYAYALRAKGYPVDRIVVQYVHRENTDKAAAFEYAYDEERAERVLAGLQALAVQLELRIEPDRGRAGPTTDALCRLCPARNHCWNIPEAERLGVSPENLTILGPTPDDLVVNELGLALIDAREKKNAAAKVEKELNALLDGVELKAYEDIEVVPGAWNSSTAWDDYRAEVERGWQLPDALRPADPPTPRVTRKRNKPTCKPLSKATKDKRAKERAAAAVQLEAAPEPADTITVPSERVQEPPRALPAAS